MNNEWKIELKFIDQDDLIIESLDIEEAMELMDNIRIEMLKTYQSHIPIVYFNNKNEKHEEIIFHRDEIRSVRRFTNE